MKVHAGAVSLLGLGAAVTVGAAGATSSTYGAATASPTLVASSRAVTVRVQEPSALPVRSAVKLSVQAPVTRAPDGPDSAQLPVAPTSIDRPHVGIRSVDGLVGWLTTATDGATVSSSVGGEVVDAVSTRATPSVPVVLRVTVTVKV